VPPVSFLLLLLFCMHYISNCMRTSIVIQLHLLFLTTYSPPFCLLLCSETHGQNPVVPKTCVDLAGPAFAALEEMRTTCSVRSTLHCPALRCGVPLLPSHGVCFPCSPSHLRICILYHQSSNLLRVYCNSRNDRAYLLSTHNLL
jgi:hypothetical protein